MVPEDDRSRSDRLTCRHVPGHPEPFVVYQTPRGGAHDTPRRAPPLSARVGALKRMRVEMRKDSKSPKSRAIFPRVEAVTRDKSQVTGGIWHFNHK